jgi:hypothetical protein
MINDLINCLVSLCIFKHSVVIVAVHIYYIVLWCFSYLKSSDGKLLEESTSSICKSVAIHNCKSGNFGALIRNFLVRATELKASVQCDE